MDPRQGLDPLLRKYEENYVRRTQLSRKQHLEAGSHLAGGVAGNNKFMKPHPMYVRSAEGSRFIDLDGNEYVDLLMGAGPLILGHGHTAIVAAVEKQLRKGLHLLLATDLETELASRIRRHMPYVELLRFATTGSEATVMAVRVARAYTARERIAKFEGHFHGHANDNLLVSSIVPGKGEPDRPEGAPDWAGIPRHVVSNVVVLPFNNIDASVALIKEHARELAAVILEPTPFASIGGIPPEKGFLEAIREATAREGILLIFDEIVTGFRLGLGGAGRYFGVYPDLVSLGKIIGGGLPLGAFGGRKDIMDAVVSPTREPSEAVKKVFQSGTFTANPLSLAAGIAALDELAKPDIYADLRKKGDRLRQGLRDAAVDEGTSVVVAGVESMFNLHFMDGPLRNRRDALRADPHKNRVFCFGLLARGVYWPLMHGGLLSAAHTDSDIEQVLSAASEVLQEMATAGTVPATM